MKDCNYNIEILKNKCLKVLPMQIVEYYKINKANADNIKENFKFIDTKISLYNNELVESSPPIYMEASVPYMGQTHILIIQTIIIFLMQVKKIIIII